MSSNKNDGFDSLNFITPKKQKVKPVNPNYSTNIRKKEYVNNGITGKLTHIMGRKSNVFEMNLELLNNKINEIAPKYCVKSIIKNYKNKDTNTFNNMLILEKRYSSLKDHITIHEGKKFTKGYRQRILPQIHYKNNYNDKVVDIGLDERYNLVYNENHVRNLNDYEYDVFINLWDALKNAWSKVLYKFIENKKLNEEKMESKKRKIGSLGGKKRKIGSLGGKKDEKHIYIKSIGRRKIRYLKNGKRYVIIDGKKVKIN